MAFRASNQIQADALSEAKRRANDLKTYVNEVKAASAAGPISGNVAVALMERLVSDKARFTAIAAVPGIGTYAQEQESDGAYNVATEFAAMQTAIDGLGAWLIANVNTTGWVTFSAGGVATKTFSIASTAGLRTAIDSLTATIS